MASLLTSCQAAWRLISTNSQTTLRDKAYTLPQDHPVRAFCQEEGMVALCTAPPEA